MPRATDGPRRARVLVLLDATAARLRDGDATGYVDALASGLDGDLVITCRRGDVEHYRRLAPAAIVESGPRGLRFRAVRMLWRQFTLPRIARRHDVDAVHSPWPPVPLLLTRPRVVTVHDLGFYDKGQPVHRRAPLRRLALRAAVRISDEIIVPGRDTAAALERATTFPADEALVLARGPPPRGPSQPPIGSPTARQLPSCRPRQGRSLCRCSTSRHCSTGAGRRPLTRIER